MADESEPCFSLVTGTRNRPDAIARMIRSALDHVDASFELLVGDASDRPGGFERIDPRVEVIREPEPLGYTRGFNALFRRARGRFVCFLNDDVELPPGWGSALLAATLRHPEVDLFCLPVIERGESAPSILLFMGMPFACMGAVRREAGEALGWFDEGYAFYGADPDLSLRLIASGRRLAPAPPGAAPQLPAQLVSLLPSARGAAESDPRLCRAGGAVHSADPGGASGEDAPREGSRLVARNLRPRGARSRAGLTRSAAARYCT